MHLIGHNPTTQKIISGGFEMMNEKGFLVWLGYFIQTAFHLPARGESDAVRDEISLPDEDRSVNRVMDVAPAERFDMQAVEGPSASVHAH
jgi:hypothetical protein